MKTEILLLFTLFQTAVFGQSLKDVKTWGGTSTEFINCVETDDFGNVYIAGNFDGTFEFGSSKITSKNGADAFIARLNDDFSVVWKVHLSNADTVLVNALDFDKNGNIYVGGVYQKEFDANHTKGKATLKNTNNNSVFDGFAIKLDSLGKLQGSFVVNESTGNELHDILVTQNDFVIGAGQITGNKSKPDGFLIGTSLNGKSAWKQEMVGAGDDVYTSVAEHKSGDIIVSGYFSSSAKFDGGKVAKSAQGTAAVLGVYSEKGVFENTVLLYDGEVRAKHVLVSDDIVYVSGLYSGFLGSVSSYRFEDAFIALIDYNDSTNDFTSRWTSHIHNFGALDINGISLSNDEKEVALTGYYYGDLYSGLDTLFDPKLPDAFCAFFETNRGNTNKLIRMGSETGTTLGLGISTYKDGYLVSGAFGDEADFGDSTITAKGNVDAFLAQVDELTVWMRPDSITRCRDTDDTIEVVISISVKGEFYKGNEVHFEISKDRDFKTYFTQNIQDPFNTVATVQLVDTLSIGQYYVRLASTKPRIASKELRAVFIAPNLTTTPITEGPDSVSAREPYNFYSKHNDINRTYSSWWSSSSDYIVNGSKIDSVLNITFSRAQTLILRTRNISEFGCQSPTAEKSVVIAPENTLWISNSKSFYSCSHDTFGFSLYTEGYFGSSYEFVVLMDSNSSFSNPQFADTIKLYQDLYSDEVYVIINISELDRTSYYLKVVAVDPFIEVYSEEKVILGTIPARPVITGSKSVKQNDAYQYQVNGGNSGNYRWIIESGEIITGDGTSTVEVKWTQAGAGTLLCAEINGCIGQRDTFKTDITSSINSFSNGIDIYPNPAKNEIFLNVYASATFSVMSLDGKKLIENISLTKGQNTVDVSQLKSGIYMLQLVSENETNNLIWKVE